MLTQYESVLLSIENIAFSDGSTVKDRMSAPIEQNGEQNREQERGEQKSNISFTLSIDGIALAEAENIKAQIIKQLSSLERYKKITIVLTGKKNPLINEADQKINNSEINNSKITRSEITNPDVRTDARNIGNNNDKIDANTHGKKTTRIRIEGISNIIAITAGKGGVGKSTITALLASRLAAEGKKVGIVDADIYGPSIPHIFNVNYQPEVKNKKIIPLENYGVKINSIGLFAPAGAAISWRGPMTGKALYQLLSLTDWGQLDYLLIDMPPGTGDIPLSLLTNYYIDAAIAITTPQKISYLDVQRTIDLYRKFNIPVTGIIENMSYFLEHTTTVSSVGFEARSKERVLYTIGERHKIIQGDAVPKFKSTDYNKPINIFPGNSGLALAKQYNIPLLAKVPVIPDLSAECDLGNSLFDFIYLLNDIKL